MYKAKRGQKDSKDAPCAEMWLIVRINEYLQGERTDLMQNKPRIEEASIL